jgi:hypothetical protein
VGHKPNSLKPCPNGTGDHHSDRSRDHGQAKNRTDRDFLFTNKIKHLGDPVAPDGPKFLDLGATLPQYHVTHRAPAVGHRQGGLGQMQYIYIVRWSYAEHCAAFATLEAAQQCACDGDHALTWSNFDTDMRDVEMWESSSYTLHGDLVGTYSGKGHVTITKYPLGFTPMELAGF